MPGGRRPARKWGSSVMQNVYKRRLSLKHHHHEQCVVGGLHAPSQTHAPKRGESTEPACLPDSCRLLRAICLVQPRFEFAEQRLHLSIHLVAVRCTGARATRLVPPGGRVGLDANQAGRYNAAWAGFCCKGKMSRASIACTALICVPIRLGSQTQNPCSRVEGGSSTTAAVGGSSPGGAARKAGNAAAGVERLRCMTDSQLSGLPRPV